MCVRGVAAVAAAAAAAVLVGDRVVPHAVDAPTFLQSYLRLLSLRAACVIAQPLRPGVRVRRGARIFPKRRYNMPRSENSYGIHG